MLIENLDKIPGWDKICDSCSHQISEGREQDPSPCEIVDGYGRYSQLSELGMRPGESLSAMEQRFWTNSRREKGDCPVFQPKTASPRSPFCQASGLSIF